VEPRCDGFAENPSIRLERCQRQARYEFRSDWNLLPSEIIEPARRHRRRWRSSDPRLKYRRCHFSTRARQRVHGQPDRGDRRAVVAGDRRPRTAAPAGLTPRTTISPPRIWNGPVNRGREVARESTASIFLSLDVQRRPVFGRQFCFENRTAGTRIFIFWNFSGTRLRPRGDHGGHGGGRAA
jgi:hypothetical protein